MSGGRGKIRPEDGVPFKKNDSRINRGGRPKKLPDLDELLRDTLGEELEGKTAMRLIIEALRKKAMKGDIRAGELLMDRAYGKLKIDKNISMKLEQLSEEQLTQLINELLNRE